MTKKLKTRKAATRLDESPVNPIDALIKNLDLVAVDMESRWGAGVLPSLCTPETAAKFFRVNESLDVAIRGGDYDTVKAKVESLKRGWHKMEEEAKQAGYPKQVEAWYVCSPEMGIEYIIAKHEADSSILAAQNPSKASSIFTLKDIAKMIEDGSVVKHLTLTNPEVKYFEQKVKTFNEELLNDEIPW